MKGNRLGTVHYPVEKGRNMENGTNIMVGYICMTSMYVKTYLPNCRVLSNLEQLGENPMPKN